MDIELVKDVVVEKQPQTQSQVGISFKHLKNQSAKKKGKGGANPENVAYVSALKGL